MPVRLAHAAGEFCLPAVTEELRLQRDANAGLVIDQKDGWLGRKWGHSAGNSRVKVAPLLGSLWTRMEPPCCCMSRLQTARPRPEVLPEPEKRR